MPDNAPVKTRPRIRKAASTFHHGDLRSAAIHVARRLVEERGHDALTLEHIAVRLAVTRPALYRHFADRDALLVAVAADGFERFADAFQAGLTLSPDPAEALLAGCRAYVRFAVEHRGWFRLQFSRGPGGAGAAHVSTPRPYVGVMRNHIATLIGPDPDTVSAAFRLLWAQAHGLAHLIVDGAFQLVQTDDARIAVAEETLAMQLRLLSAWSRREAPVRDSQPDSAPAGEGP